MVRGLTDILKHEVKKMNEEQFSKLIGYVRKSNAGGAMKVSINVDAFNECSPYTTADGQRYVPLTISINSLKKVLAGERALTTICNLQGK